MQLWVVIGAAAAVFVLAFVIAGSFDLFATDAADPDQHRGPVLPDGFGVGDVDSLRFQPALRGYRMDEVDEAIGALRARIADLEARPGSDEGEPQATASVPAPDANGANRSDS